MEVIVDLKGRKNEKEVLLKFGDTLSFPGWWGVNWDAFNDCLSMLDELSENKILISPLKVKIQNFVEFKEALPDRFKIMEEILQHWVEEYKKEGKEFEVEFA